MHGMHPKTGVPLPVPRNTDGTVWQGAGGEGTRDYLQGMTSNGKRIRDDGFYVHEPAKFIKISGSEPGTTPTTFNEILERV